MKKVIEKLNFILKLVESNLANTKKIELVYKECADAIKEVEELQSRSCENCISSEKCKTLHYVYKDRLKKEGYSMNKFEFYCNKWELSK